MQTPHPFANLSPNSRLLRTPNGFVLLDQMNQHAGEVLSTYLNASANFFINDVNSKIQMCNQAIINVVGLNSHEEILGKNILDLRMASAEAAMANDQRVMMMRKLMIVDEYTECHGHPTAFVSLKLPLFDSSEKVIGVIGSSVAFKGATGASALALFITRMISLKMLPPDDATHLLKPALKQENEKITKREKEILLQLVRGKTAKEIGKVLGISFRTVYQHLENVKNKLHVKSKSELIDCVIDLFV